MLIYLSKNYNNVINEPTISWTKSVLEKNVLTYSFGLGKQIMQ